jgi:hypothetical protein
MKGRTQSLTPLVDWIARKLNRISSKLTSATGIEFPHISTVPDGGYLHSRGYCRLFMAVKGFVIGAAGAFSLILLWPLAYEIGKRFQNHALSELLSGAFAGVALVLSVHMFT